MTTLSILRNSDAAFNHEQAVRRARAKAVYFSLLREEGGQPGQIDELAHSASRLFLCERLDDASRVDSSFPDDVRSLAPWLEDSNREASCQYRRYLDERAAGAPRRFFRSRAHALNFLRSVAPTKLVDGAWLYGLLSRHSDPRLAMFIQIYLEELGDGRARQNHVLLYRELLRSQGCDHWDGLADEHYTQGAIQLALAHHVGEFLPEVIGFNLGYEQLPLHLPVTAYELNELDIDPYYFTLHTTIDNASTGHARRSLDGLLEAWPRVGDGRAFFQRVANGYRLNMLGIGTVQAIEAFDLQRELLAMLTDKAAVGAPLHSDYCRIGGRTVNDWLSKPGGIPLFLMTLERAGWIKRGQDPQNSRFWRLLHDDRAPMFGVFDGYEQALIADWITDAPRQATTRTEPVAPPRAVNRFRRRGVSAEESSPAALRTSLAHGATTPELVRFHLGDAQAAGDNDFDADLRQLVGRLSSVSERGEALALLPGFMSPANHHTPAGLAATRIFASLFAGRG